MKQLGTCPEILISNTTLLIDQQTQTPWLLIIAQFSPQYGTLNYITWPRSKLQH